MAASRKRPPNKTVAAIVAAGLARHFSPLARLTLALSGGVDSVVLLHVLQALRDQYPFELQAVHVHHGLSPHADAWADFCARLCASHEVKLTVHRVQIASNDEAGIEAAARHERQRIFAAIDTDALLTAHHQNDQAETLMLQLLRGAGPKGLAAMAGVQQRRGWLAAHWRPLLGMARSDLLDYAHAHQLLWMEDESNQDTRFRRNALRQEVLPLLNAHFPGADATLARAAGLQAEAAALLDDLAHLDAVVAIAGERLDCASLTALSMPRARNLLRYFIEQHGHPMPNARQLNEALHQLRDARQDARVCVCLGQDDLWRYRGGAYLVPRVSGCAEAVRWRGESVLHLPAAGVAVQFEAVTGAGLKRALLESGEVTLGVREGGERLRLHAGGSHRSLKNLLQEHAIPPWQRDRLPLLRLNGELLWAACIGFDSGMLAAPGEAGVMPRVVG